MRTGVGRRFSWSTARQPITPDGRGSLRNCHSDTPSSPWTVVGGERAATARSITWSVRRRTWRAVAEAIGEPVFILGHSHGAACSLEAALLTDRIHKMILYEPPIPTGVRMYPPGVPDEMQSLVDEGHWESALELFFKDVVRMPEHELAQYRRLPMWKRRVQLAPTIPRELAIDTTYRFVPEKFADFEFPRGSCWAGTVHRCSRGLSTRCTRPYRILKWLCSQVSNT